MLGLPFLRALQLWPLVSAKTKISNNATDTLNTGHVKAEEVEEIDEVEPCKIYCLQR
ncbi:Bgt-20466 [Blumeria graminis f. sp. tritici]|uniref:Bgt-20466 n=2 Tax=Blumeria graminis f. sp. tritici TaxID=62690 RepID=A0A381LD40_BLUGR|nr:Bgt-20466 [Blumeria graminis f. sp. tritici]